MSLAGTSCANELPPPGAHPDLQPPIVVEITPQDYAAGRDPQLERGISEVLAQIERLDLILPDLATRPTRQIPKLPPRS